MKTHAKTATWLIVSGFLIFGAAYWETRDVYLSCMAALWACLLKTPVFWVHEHLWESLAGKPDERTYEDFVAERLIEQLKETQRITEFAMKNGLTIDRMVDATVSELGEFVDAYRSEIGEKPRDLKEDSRWEAGDVTICALSLFFGREGHLRLLAAVLEEKNAKWAGNVGYKIPDQGRD